eukprot:1550838-Amphidinium_carterae.1
MQEQPEDVVRETFLASFGQSASKDLEKRHPLLFLIRVQGRKDPAVLDKTGTQLYNSSSRHEPPVQPALIQLLP